MGYGAKRRVFRCGAKLVYANSVCSSILFLESLKILSKIAALLLNSREDGKLALGSTICARPAATR